ncbi:MAG: hypothetical protein AB7S36_20930 [Planctomycetota bacterium]
MTKEAISYERALSLVRAHLPPVASKKQVAEFFGVSKWTVWAWSCRDGLLERQRVGKNGWPRFTQEAVARFLCTHRTKAPELEITT